MAFRVSQIIKHNGQWYNPGDYIDDADISKKELKRLREKSAGNEVVIEVLTSDVILNNDAIKTPGGDDEPLEEVLDLNFKTNELKDGAAEQGLSFASNIKKSNLIALIIENGKEEYFLDQLAD